MTGVLGVYLVDPDGDVSTPEEVPFPIVGPEAQSGLKFRPVKNRPSDTRFPKPRDSEVKGGTFSSYFVTKN